MSVTAIAAALAREDLSAGERLVAFSLSSFADRGNRAWPGAPAAAARAGLSRSRYLQARDQLARRGLVVVEDAATGRGRSSTVGLRFADEGPWSEEEINAPLFEAVLAYSRARGPARLLLAAMAALANGERVVEDLTTEQLCSAAGLADRTYRRARQALLASGALVLLSGIGGRGNPNRWAISDPRVLAGEHERRSVGRRVPPPAGARPLVAPVAAPVSATSHQSPAGSNLGPVNAAGKGGQDQTLSVANRPILAGVSGLKGGHDRTLSPLNRPILTGVSGVKGGQDHTLFAPAEAETPAERAAKTPAANARAGREPQNPRTREHPPSPPEGGSSDASILIEETYLTDRGRTRRRVVRVDLDEVRRNLAPPSLADRGDWDRIRALVLDAVGESTFSIWLARLQLIAVDPSGAMVWTGPAQTLSWVRHRFGELLAACGERIGRDLRIAGERERSAMRSRISAAGASDVCLQSTKRRVS